MTPASKHRSPMTDKQAWLTFHNLSGEEGDRQWQAKVQMHANPPRSAMVYVMSSYQSPVTGKWIDTPAQRRDDLARTGSRPWEGMESEKRHAASVSKQMDADMDKTAEKIAVEMYQRMPDALKTELA